MEIKSFEQFLNEFENSTKHKGNKINEVGDRPYPVTWENQGDNLYGKFYLDDIEFNIRMTPLWDDTGNDIKIYQFKFSRGKDGMEAFGDFKYNFKVFSTIQMGLYYCMDIINPDILVFSTSDHNRARKEIYKTAATYLLTRYHYYNAKNNSNPQISNMFSDELFCVYRNEEVINQALLMSGL